MRRVRLLSSAQKRHAPVTAAAPAAIAGSPGVQPEHDAAGGHDDRRDGDPRAQVLVEDDPGQQDREDDLEIEQERRRHGRASLKAPEEQRRGEHASREDDAGQDPAIARGQRPAGRRTAAPEPARQTEKDAGAEIEDAGQEQRWHDVEQPLRERRAEPEGERGDQRVEDRHDDAPPLYSAAALDRVTFDDLAHRRPPRPSARRAAPSSPARAGRRRRRSGCS